jgi:hypothetical protein
MLAAGFSSPSSLRIAIASRFSALSSLVAVRPAPRWVAVAVAVTLGH